MDSASRMFRVRRDVVAPARSNVGWHELISIDKRCFLDKSATKHITDVTVSLACEFREFVLSWPKNLRFASKVSSLFKCSCHGYST